MADDPRKPKRDEQASLVTRKACFAWIAKMSASRAVVYSTARDGQLKKLKLFIERCAKDDIGYLVSAKTHGATPLVMACRNGHYDVAEYLIEKCDADIEQPGSVVYDGDTIEEATPLWCAAAAGHLNIVKLLVRKGANVNSTTKSNSTPLRAACFDGYYDIIKFLISHGADFELANSHGHTCLMIACYRGHIKIVKYLLDLKADTNRKSIKGNTALHDCAESGSLEILKILVEHGARMDVDTYGMTPLFAAAVTGHTHIVEYLIGIPHLTSRSERIDALELLGATYVDKKKDMVGALALWRRAMDERYNKTPKIPKPTLSKMVEAYDYVKETSDPEALEELLGDPDEMRMQALVIRERILGPAHPDTCYYIRYRGAIYADAGKFNRCIELWNYALEMQQNMLDPLNCMTQSTLFGFTELFSFMISEEGLQSSRGRLIPPVKTEEMLRVFKRAVWEVKQGKQLLDVFLCGKSSERETVQLHRVLNITLYLACLLIRKTPEKGSKEWMDIHRVLYELVKINAKGKQGRDVLQLTHSEDMTLFGKYPICKFPLKNLTMALLRVGADINARDADGNTSLHLVAICHRGQTSFATTLLDAGAHIDAVNNDGQTYETLLKSRSLYESVSPVKYTSLKCLAAKVIRKHGLKLHVPKHLQEFVEMH